jgi:hypothetical protein
MDLNLLAQAMGITPEKAARMDAAWKVLNDDGQIEWHCRRHGVIRDVPADKAGEIEEVIVWFMGSRSSWWTGTHEGKRSVEFYNNSKVFPQGTRPWSWCGTTVLWQDWRDREERHATILRTFEPGDKVWFEYKKVRKYGEVMYLNQKTVAVWAEGNRWIIPPQDLHRAEGL